MGYVIDKMLHSYFNILGEVSYIIALPFMKQFGFGFFISEKMLDTHIFFQILIPQELASLWAKKSFQIAVAYFLLKGLTV